MPVLAESTLKDRLLTITSGVRRLLVTEEAGEVMIVSTDRAIIDRAAAIADHRDDIPPPDRRAYRRSKIYSWAICWEVQ